MKRRVYLIEKPGSLKRLRLTEAELSEPGDTEVRVAVKSIGLNYADIFTILGLYKAAPRKNIIPGLEFSGIVTDTGKSVQVLKKGDRVMGVSKFGAYTDTINIDEKYAIPIPDNWSFSQGASFLVQVLTAWYALINLGNLKKGQTVLINSAAGGVGLLANRIAKKFDAYTIGITGHAEKLDLLSKEGFNVAFVRDKNFRTNLQKVLKNRELNLVLETSGDKYFQYLYKALAPQGRIITYGSAQFTPSGNAPNYALLALKYLRRPRLDPLTMITENKSVMAFNLIWLYERFELMWELMDEINKLSLDPPFIGHTFPFEKLNDALILFKSGKTMGKVVIEVE
jgi:NADPH:quinone reductase-like Zn-dependent oxidoreductase